MHQGSTVSRFTRSAGARRVPVPAFLLAFLLPLFVGAAEADSQGIPISPGLERFVPGEGMTIYLPLDPESFLNGGYPIDSAGVADLPVVGRLEVGGRTRDEVEVFLAQKLSNYLKDTRLRALPAIRLSLLGHFTRQGQYYVSANSTVWDAMMAAGGIAGERTLDDVTVMRGESTLGIRLLEEFSRGRTLTQAGIRSGDIFVIPVPREDTGGWYWFMQGLTATAQIATIVGTFLTAYVTLTVLDNQQQ